MKENQLGQEQKNEDTPEQEKLREIAKRSKQFVVLSGPSGSGKTMIIKHLVDKYDFVEPSFVTTRELRSGEAEIGGIQLDTDEFSRQEAENKIFLPARNYGNAYGYSLDVIFELAQAGSNIVVEAPASNLTGNVHSLLPESTVIGVLPPSIEELEAQLQERGLNDDADQRVRLQGAQAIKGQIIEASESMEIKQLIPTHGIPEDTIVQVDKLMEEKGFKIKE